MTKDEMIAKGIRVKTLVWTDESVEWSYPDRMVAKVPCASGEYNQGHYSIAGNKKTGEWEWFVDGYYWYPKDGKMSEADAKAKAQAHFERRVLALIEGAE